MIHQPVNSSNIESIAYDIRTGDLEIRFKHGGLYVYQGVPADEYQALLSAPSVGSHFHQRIRNNYSWTRP